MSRKRLLIISYIYPPFNAPAARRPYSWAKYLDKSKFDITVITCGNADSSLGKDSSFNETLEGVNLIKIDSSFNPKKGSSLRNTKFDSGKVSLKGKTKKLIVKLASYLLLPDKAVFWYKPVIKYLKENRQLIKDIDIVITTSPVFTNHSIGRKIKKWVPDATFLVDFRDFHFIEHHKEYSPPPFSWIQKRYEKSALKAADKVTFISHSMLKVYAASYPDIIGKSHVIYNGFDPEDFVIDNKQIDKKERLTFFYAGSFYSGVRSPRGLLNVLELAIQNGLISKNDVEICIAGNFEVDLRRSLESHALYDCISYLGQISRSEVIARYQQADVLWLIVGKKVSHYTGVPLKFYEYIASLKPIINFAPSASEPSYLIDLHNLGWNIDDTDALEIQYKTIEKLVQEWQAGNLDSYTSKEVLKLYNRKTQTEELEEILL